MTIVTVMVGPDEPTSAWQDAIGLIGIALVIAGLSDIPAAGQLLCLIGAAVCLLLSFSNQTSWPVAVRWLLSILALALLSFMSLSAIKRL